MKCPHENCKERLFMGGNIWIEKSVPVTSGSCSVHGVIKFKLYDKICEIEKTYPDGHNQIEKIREQKQDLIARFPAIKGEII
jgi:hypothetical protein